MQEVYDFANEKMTKSVKSLHNEYVSMRAGKASVSLLDKVVVDYYGCPTPFSRWLPSRFPRAEILSFSRGT